ncbi:hypothetical protein Tco_0466354 [Tanacetum coccineum]
MEMQEVVLFYNGLDVPTRQILDSRGAIPSKTAADAKTAIQEMAEYSQKWHNGTSRVRSTETSEGLAAIQAQLNNLGREIKSKFKSELAKRHEENSNLIKEIRALTDAAIQNQGASMKTLEIRIGQMSKNRTLMYEKRQTKILFLSRLNGYYCNEKKGSYGPQFSEAYSEASHINNSIPRKEKYLGSFTLPCFIKNDCFDNALVDLGTTITLRIREERIIFKSVKSASSLIKRVYMLSLRERMKLDLEVRLMGDTLVINRSLDPLNGDYIKLNDLNEPFKLRRNQGDDLIPTIEEGEVIEEFKTRDDELDTRIGDYPSYCHHDKKIHIDCAYNLKFSCMIGFEFTHVNFFPLLYVNVMSKKFHNFKMNDKMVYKGNNVIGALMYVPIFVGTFSVVTDFAVLENMDAYRDKGMGDVIFGEPFLREVGIKARRFEWMITIYNGNESVTYQMVRSHLRFKHHTNEHATRSHHY